MLIAGEVIRFRRNDYVGPPIWGFRGLPPNTVEGDVVYQIDRLFDPPRVNFYTVARVNGKLACLNESGRFAGFVG
jgi:hypothetical protein